MVIVPFRWNIAVRTRLGGLCEGQRADVYRGFSDDLLKCCARVLGFAGNSDLIFVGRSPESLFDHLSGLLFDTEWGQRIELLHFSMRWTDKDCLCGQYPGAIGGLRSYLGHLKLGPGELLLRERPAALVDLVATGATFGNFVMLLKDWAADDGVDWRAIQHKLRLVGITRQKKTSPKTWRWNQHASWIEVMKRGSVKSVSVPQRLWDYLGNYQEKVTPSHTPARWGDSASTVPTRQPEHLRALRLALQLFEHGRDKRRRSEFARLLVQEAAMRHAWFRDLVKQLC